MFLLMRQSEWQAMHVNMNYVCAAHTHQSYQSIFLSSHTHTHTLIKHTNTPACTVSELVFEMTLMFHYFQEKEAQHFEDCSSKPSANLHQ